MKLKIGPSICVGIAALFCIQSGWAATEATEAASSEVASMPAAEDTNVAPEAKEVNVEAVETTTTPANNDVPALDESKDASVPDAAPADAVNTVPNDNDGETMTEQQSPEQFMAENAKQENVQSTESGLQYKILTAGTGPQPKASDTVTVQYEGRLVDGTVFDSSYKRGQPAQFGLNQVIQGWTEGLQLMHEGAIWELYIPASLAYGPNGIPGVIPPNSPLVFKVELVKIAG